MLRARLVIQVHAIFAAVVHADWSWSDDWLLCRAACWYLLEDRVLCSGQQVHAPFVSPLEHAHLVISVMADQHVSLFNTPIYEVRWHACNIEYH